MLNNSYNKNIFYSNLNFGGDFVDKVLDKLGLYDIVAVLLSGMVITTLSYLLLTVVYAINIEALNNGFDSGVVFIFLILSYFIGLVFQELGSLFQFTVHKLIHNNSLAMYKTRKHWKKEKDNGQKSYQYITKAEFELLKEKLQNVDMDSKEWNDNTIFYYCKKYKEADDMNFIEKLQSLSGMSRSFAIYFFIVFVSSFVYYVSQQPYQINLKLFVPIIAFALFLIFYFRFTRFVIVRYTKIFRSYLYSNINEKSENNQERNSS